MTNLNNIEAQEPTKQPSKYSKFLDNTKKAVRDTLIKTWIAASTMAPMATTTTSTVIPASINTITAIAPSASTAISTISLWTAAGLLTACSWWGEDGPDIPVKPDKPTEKDTTAPTIDVTLSEIDITWWKEIKITGNQLYIWSDLIASWSDNKTQNCNVTISLNWKSITSWDTIDGGWTLTISVKDDAGNSKSIDIKLDQYKTMEISNIRPSDILPILKDWEGNQDIQYLDVIKLAETTRIRDMMREYGAGNHSPEEYQKLMSRLNTGMLSENPKWYDNFEILWWGLDDNPDWHAHNERNILNTLINHANFKIINKRPNREKLYDLCKKDPTKINIFWLSTDRGTRNKSEYDNRHEEKYKEYDKEKNRLVFKSWWNIWGSQDWILLNKIYQEDYSLPDKHSVYSEQSRAHNKTDNILDRHLMLTIGTNHNGDIDQTNNIYNSSKFPVWFHDKVLFAWRAFPYIDVNWQSILEWWKYATSYTNYLNVAMMDLCFQMFADTKDVDELLDMVRSTSLTDYIRFDLNWDGDTDDNINGQPETQPLQLINPAWFFQWYLMPTDLPNNVKSWENIPLKKWYYKWVVFDIPWAEVKINWEWIEYSEKNKSIIKNQNPMTLEWRLNGDLCKKIYWEWKNIEWKIIVVDDKWNWLNINKDFSIKTQ